MQMPTPDNITEICSDGARRPVTREWVAESPIALEFNGLSYAVMMATPEHLEDFLCGFALTEGLAANIKEIEGISIADTGQGHIARARLTGPGVGKLEERVRMRVAESSCGLCGIENLEALAKPLPSVAAHTGPEPAAVFAALDKLRGNQPMNARTNAAHAAAFADDKGSLLLVREDVGRHNAIDKLVGALARNGIDPASGFFISTARCSYEIVEKVVRAGGTTLATISLPTSMAVARARQAGLTVISLARGDSYLKVHPAD